MVIYSHVDETQLEKMKHVVMIEFTKSNSMMNGESNIKYYDGGKMFEIDVYNYSYKRINL